MIKGYEGYYEISNHGRVRSLPRIIKARDGQTRNLKGKLLSSKTHHTGYNNIFLSKNGEKKYIGVHRLVAIHFIENPDKLEIVNHINEIRDDNHYSNLEWVTHAENISYNDAFQKGREKVKKEIFQYTLDWEFVRNYSFAKEVEEYGFRPKSVAQVCLGYKNTHYGYFWRYD